MAFHRPTLMILYSLFLCTKLPPVLSQTSTGSPVVGPSLPPVTAPGPVSAGVPVPSAGLQPQPQVTNMIEALRDAGRFGAIAGLLDGLQMKSLTPMTTWFLPNDQAFSGINYPKNVTTFLDYHVVPELLPFSRLLTLSTGTRIPTFLGTDTSVVTNNSQLNFSIDNARVVIPDLYSDSTIAVHGIDAVLDAASFNGRALPPVSAASPASPVSSQSPQSSCPKGETCPSAPLPFGFNITFPNAADGLYSTTGFYMTVASASILVVTALL